MVRRALDFLLTIFMQRKFNRLGQRNEKLGFSEALEAIVKGDMLF